MRGITELSKIGTSSGAVRVRLATAVAACAFAAACSQSSAGPTMPTAGPASAATVAQDTSQSWEDFEAHGWNCRTPRPGVVVCSPPGQPLPVPAFPPAVPPADRPETVVLKRWVNGVFDANVLLIRPEIYNGQPCGPAGEPYTYVGVLGYFECAHAAGN
jgi:hypothetical protein